MNYLDDPARLGRIMKSLAEHEAELRRSSLGGLLPRIVAIDNLEDKLVKLFVLANADRQGTGKDNENLLRATATFREYLDQGIIGRLLPMTPSDAHRYLLRHLCDIKWMDQKTANLFLKFTVLFADELHLTKIDWRSWEVHLHVPLDMWVLRLMGSGFLRVCGVSFETAFRRDGDYPSPSLKAARYAQLQDDIRKVAASASLRPIVLDSLWFVGSHYCSYHPLLCDICWLGEYCARHQIVNWAQVPVTLKSDERERYRQSTKAMGAIRRIWMSQNPGKTDSDLSHFLEQPEGREWYAKLLAEWPSQPSP